MPQLGLGLGLDKTTALKPLPKWLTDAGCTFAINVDRQVKALANPNTPFINPLVDVVGKLGKNLFDPTKATGATYLMLSNGIRVSSYQTYIPNPFILKPNTQYTFSRIATVVSGTPISAFGRLYLRRSSDNAEIIFLANGSGSASATVTTPSDIATYNQLGIIGISGGIGDITNIQLEENSTATTYEPYGFNNVLLQSYAGTTSDGYTKIALPNGKNPWFVNSDGTDSYMIGVNNSDTDILGTVNFGLGFYTRTNGTLVNSWLISKAESSEATTQYGVKITSAGALQLFLNGTAITLATGLAINTPYKIVIVREAGTLKCEVNDVETYSAAETTSLTTRPNLRLGARSSNVGGTTHTEFYNGHFGAFDLSQGSLCTLASFKKSFAKLIGGTYV